jgi:hypothetical protein
MHSDFDHHGLIGTTIGRDSTFPTIGSLMQVNRGHRLFFSAMFTPGLYTESMYENSTVTSEIGHASPDVGIEDYYPSFAFGDDLFWASTWLYRAAKNNIREFNITYYKEAMTATMNLACAAPLHPRCTLHLCPARVTTLS